MSAHAEQLTVAHITDAHVAPHGRPTATMKHLSLAVFEDLVAQCRERGVDLVLFGGDNIDNRGHGREDLQAFMDVAAGLDRWLCIPGNHEAPPSGDITKDRFLRAVQGHGPESGFAGFNQGVGDVRVIGIDTSLTGSPGGYLAPGMMRFLAESIRHAEEPHILVLGHHPLYRAWEPLQMDVWDREYLVANRHDVVALLAAAPKVRAYLCGHHHASRIQRVGRPGGSGFYHVLTASPVAYPHMGRILHIGEEGIRVETLVPRLPGLVDAGRQAVLTGRKAMRFSAAGASDFLDYLVGASTDNVVFLPHQRSASTLRVG